MSDVNFEELLGSKEGALLRTLLEQVGAFTLAELWNHLPVHAMRASDETERAHMLRTAMVSRAREIAQEASP